MGNVTLVCHRDSVTDTFIYSLKMTHIQTDRSQCGHAGLFNSYEIQYIVALVRYGEPGTDIFVYSLEKKERSVNEFEREKQNGCVCICV